MNGSEEESSLEIVDCYVVGAPLTKFHLFTDFPLVSGTEAQHS